MERKFFFLILSIIVFSCNSENNKRIKFSSSLNLDSPIPKGINASSIFSSISFIPLEKKVDKIIGNVNKIIYKDSIIYIGTKNSIFVYSLGGKYLFDISNKGEAPNQYRSISDFDVNENIEVMDHFRKKIHVYSKGGEFKNIWSYPLFAISFKKMADGNHIFYSGNTPNEDNNQMFHVYSMKKNKLLKSFIEINPKVINYFQFLDVDNFPQFEGQKIYMSGSNIVYKYENGEIFPNREINLKEHGIPSEVFNKSFEDVSYFDKYLEKKDYLSPQNTFYYENKNTTILPLSRRVYEKLWLWEEKSLKRTTLINSINDDFNFDKNISYEIKSFFTVGVYENNMYFAKDPTEFLDYFRLLETKIGKDNLEEFLNNHTDLKKIYNSITIESNPIIIIAKVL